MSTPPDNANGTIALLKAFGFTARDAKKITRQVEKNGLAIEDVQAWIDEAQASTSLNNPLGFVRARLQDGDKLPQHITVDPHIIQRHHYQGWTAHLNNHAAGANRVATQTCACGRVVWQTSICEACGLCRACCTCTPENLDEE